MLKRLLIFTVLLTTLFGYVYGAKVKGENYRMDPPNWWTGMACDTLQIMVYGPGIAKAETALAPYPGVRLLKAVPLESENYLFLYLNIDKTAQPGLLDLSFKLGKQSFCKQFELKARKLSPEQHVGFGPSDVLYLVMPDRFAKAASAGGDVKEYPVATDRNNPNARHGGNIEGLRRHLDYIDSLGVTAVWVNPVLENDMPGGSYHGYATTDYYRIDPRLGTNEEWNHFVQDAHKRGIKVVMDMIFNHCGSNHVWFKDRPSRDWFNFPDGFVQTNYRLTTVHDPYASEYDRTRTVDGWFVKSMPDLNQRNPHLMKYLIQNSIWWVETSGLNGIRMDTHPYADERAMASWIEAVMKEYPRFNIVGECWYTGEASEAYWQKNSKVNPNGNPQLPTVMDFVMCQKARESFLGGTEGGNLDLMYEHLSTDYIFPDPSMILTFLDNHDTDRFLPEIPENLDEWKQALTFLLTTRGIPQLYYGTEILMNGSKSRSDGDVRRDMPGGFDGDATDAFSGKGLTSIQSQALDFLRKLLNWRKGNEAIAKGSLKHFIPQNGVYVYERKYAGKQVIVILNPLNRPVEISMSNYSEIMPMGASYRNIPDNTVFTVSQNMTLPAKATYILTR